MAGDEHPVQGIDASGEQVDVWKTWSVHFEFLLRGARRRPQSGVGQQLPLGLCVRRERQPAVQALCERLPSISPACARAGIACSLWATMSKVGEWIRGHNCQICQEAKDRSMPILVSFIKRQAVPHLSLLIRQLTM